MIEQHDQIESFRFKFVIGSTRHKKIEFDILLKRCRPELLNRYLGNVDDAYLPFPFRQPQRMSAKPTG